MPADVSQFIQMQRLLALENRRPLPNEKTITHLYQPQVLSSALTEFLPNSKTKFISGQTISRQYVPGIQAKYKIPTRNAY
jgi:hypothetical protein